MNFRLTQKASADAAARFKRSVFAAAEAQCVVTEADPQRKIRQLVQKLLRVRQGQTGRQQKAERDGVACFLRVKAQRLVRTELADGAKRPPGQLAKALQRTDGIAVDLNAYLGRQSNGFLFRFSSPQPSVAVRYAFVMTHRRQRKQSVSAS